jgi:hypothetical protein
MLLYVVVTAVLSPSEIATPFRDLEVKQRDLRVLLAEGPSRNNRIHLAHGAIPRCHHRFRARGVAHLQTSSKIKGLPAPT